MGIDSASWHGKSEQLHKLCAIRTETLCAALEEFTQHRELSRNANGCHLHPSFPGSRPIAYYRTLRMK